VISDTGGQGWVMLALAFIYGLAIMLTVIVTLSKSARHTSPAKEKHR
jgi:ABC-type nickel/cobalt efflux system permease component RcnA